MKKKNLFLFSFIFLIFIGLSFGASGSVFNLAMFPPQNVDNYMKQGGAEWVVGGDLEITGTLTMNGGTMVGDTTNTAGDFTLTAGDLTLTLGDFIVTDGTVSFGGWGYTGEHIAITADTDNTNPGFGQYFMVNTLIAANKVMAGEYSRLLIMTTDQTNSVTFVGTESQLRLRDVDLANGVHAGLWAYAEQSGTSELSTNGTFDAISACIETASTFTAGATEHLTGITIDSSVAAGAAGTIDGSCNFSAIYIKSNGLDWYYGLKITGVDEDILGQNGETWTNSDDGFWTTSGGIKATGAITGVIGRSTLTEDALAVYGLDTTKWMQADLAHMGISETAGDHYLVLGTNIITLISEVANNETEVGISYYMFVLPPEYVAAGDVKIRVKHTVAGAGTSNASTVDFSVYEQDGNGAIGSDLVTTAATEQTEDAWVTTDFVVTATDLVAGDILIIKFTSTTIENASNDIQASFDGFAVLLDIKG